MVGSVLICEAETIEEVRKMVEGDIYYTSGVVSLAAALTCRRLTMFAVGCREGGDSTVR